MIILVKKDYKGAIFKYSEASKLTPNEPKLYTIEHLQV